MGRMGEVYQKRCRCTIRLRCRGLGFFRAVVLWYSPAVSVVHRLSPGLRQAPRVSLKR